MKGLRKILRLMQLHAGGHTQIFLEWIMLHMAIEDDQLSNHSKQSLLFSPEENSFPIPHPINAFNSRHVSQAVPLGTPAQPTYYPVFSLGQFLVWVI